jgi:FeS assembly SUF system protein
VGIFSRWRKGSEPTADPPADLRTRGSMPEPTPPLPSSVAVAEPAPPAGSFVDTSALTAPSAATTGDQPAVGSADPALTAEFQPMIVETLKTVYDPEIPVDIYELGLIYDIAVDADRRALVKMTLTSPACPSAQQIPSEVRYKVKAIPGLADATVEIVWEPPWDKDRMSEAAKLQLGFY